MSEKENYPKGLFPMITKLSDTLLRGIGYGIDKTLIERIQIRNEAFKIKKIAEAKKHEIIVLAEAKKIETIKKAEANAQSIGILSKSIIDKNLKLEYKDSELSLSNSMHVDIDILEKRATTRDIHKKLIEQNNIDQIVKHTIDNLVDEEATTENDVSQDWINHFFRLGEEISDEKMQMLFAKILAGEIKRPGSFALRTLDFIKNLTYEEAQALTKVLQYTTQYRDKFFIYYDRGNGSPVNYYKSISELCNISLDEIEMLKYLNLIYDYQFHHPQSLPKKAFTMIANDENTHYLKYGKKCIKFTLKDNYSQMDMSFSCFYLTPLAIELLPFIEIKYNYEYVKKLAAKKRTIMSRIEVGDIVFTVDWIRGKNLEEIKD